MNVMRSTLLASMLLRRSPMSWLRAEKLALGLTAVLDLGGHARCSRPSLVAL